MQPEEGPPGFGKSEDPAGSGETRQPIWAGIADWVSGVSLFAAAIFLLNNFDSFFFLRASLPRRIPKLPSSASPLA